jgi:hypothetical protein
MQGAPCSHPVICQTRRFGLLGEQPLRFPPPSLRDTSASGGQTSANHLTLIPFESHPAKSVDIFNVLIWININPKNNKIQIYMKIRSNTASSVSDSFTNYDYK